MSQLKLTADSGGGTVAIKGPASTTGNAAIELTVPGTGSGTLAVGDTGKILQVKSTTKTDIFSSTAVQTWTDITGLSVNITPSSASSKILINAHISFGLDVSHSLVLFKFVRDSTEIAIADVANNRPRGTFASKPADDAHTDNAAATHLDSPNSTSQLTYKIQFYDYHANTFYVNRSYRHFDASTYDMVGVSSITVQEVAA
tara:strand:- start:757 stop:1359 length:603 start_codon:yes stop_codon:yes gene_type:complete